MYSPAFQSDASSVQTFKPLGTVLKIAPPTAVGVEHVDVQWRGWVETLAFQTDLVMARLGNNWKLAFAISLTLDVLTLSLPLSGVSHSMPMPMTRVSELPSSSAMVPADSPLMNTSATAPFHPSPLLSNIFHGVAARNVVQAKRRFK